MPERSAALAAHASFDPYWWQAAPLDRSACDAPPPHADVVIVGAGITGLVAAVHLARAGRKVAVLDAGAPGIGAATRNAGYVGRSLKHGFGETIEREGLDQAVRIYRELMEAFDSVKETVAQLGIDCHYRQQGRLLLATTPQMRDAMIREYALREKHLGEAFEPIGRSEQRAEIASDRYFGGVRIADHAGLHPGLYHRGLLAAACNAGATVCGFSPALGVRREARGFTVDTPRARIAASDVVVATNGYSARSWPWLRRRVIPFDAYQAVSAPLGEERVRRLLPGDRTFIDWNFDVDWFRRVPGNPSRIAFGGATGPRHQDLRVVAQRLRARLMRIFPDLHDLRFDHVWTGKCAGTFDFKPRIGRHDGIHFAAGYCFVGVPIGTMFGRKLAQRVLGVPGGHSVFDQPMRAMPLYRGNPWFVPLAMRWLRRHDR